MNLARAAVRRLRRTARSWTIRGRTWLRLRRHRRARARARATGAVTRILVYSPANLNVIDGSSIWVESIVATLAVGKHVWVTVPLKAVERRSLLTDALRAIDRVDVLPRPGTGSALDPLDHAAALDWIERLDDEEPFDAFLLRGFELCLAAAGRPRFAGRLWSAYLLEPERDVDSAAYQADMGRIARASRHVIVQTTQMAAATIERVPGARGRLVVLPPAVSASVPRAPTEPVDRLVYTGKFAPFYPVPDLIDAFARLRERHPRLRFELVGDKVLRSADDHAYADALAERIATVPGVVSHGGLSRRDTARLLAGGGIALSVWDYRYGSHWNDLVVSTKLLDYCAAGLPVVLTRTTAQEDILGVDYPLFASGVAEAEILIDRLLGDGDLYRAAAERCRAASRRFTYQAVYERVAPELGWAGGAG